MTRSPAVCVPTNGAVLLDDEVAGHADRSGSPAANQALSLRRAQSVAAELGRWGVPDSVIDIHAYGDTRPLVASAAGAREPQNRRVEIVYR